MKDLNKSLQNEFWEKTQPKSLFDIPQFISKYSVSRVWLYNIVTDINLGLFCAVQSTFSKLSGHTTSIYHDGFKCIREKDITLRLIIRSIY